MKSYHSCIPCSKCTRHFTELLRQQNQFHAPKEFTIENNQVRRQQRKEELGFHNAADCNLRSNRSLFCQLPIPYNKHHFFSRCKQLLAKSVQSLKYARPIPKLLSDHWLNNFLYLIISTLLGRTEISLISSDVSTQSQLPNLAIQNRPKSYR